MQSPESITKTKWGLDIAHSEIGFKVKHLMISNVKGRFKEFDASIYTTNEDFLSAEIDFWMNPASVDTSDEKRDAHLAGEDFFDAEHHKVISFVGNTFVKVDNNSSYELWGELTMKGITKQIKLDVEFGGIMKDPWGNEKAGFELHGKINRKDWGLEWNTALETGGIMVGEEIKISCELQLVKQL